MQNAGEKWASNAWRRCVYHLRWDNLLQLEVDILNWCTTIFISEDVAILNALARSLTRFSYMKEDSCCIQRLSMTGDLYPCAIRSKMWFILMWFASQSLRWKFDAEPPLLWFVHFFWVSGPLLHYMMDDTSDRIQLIWVVNVGTLDAWIAIIAMRMASTLLG